MGKQKKPQAAAKSVGITNKLAFKNRRGAADGHVSVAAAKKLEDTLKRNRYAEQKLNESLQELEKAANVIGDEEPSVQTNGNGKSAENIPKRKLSKSQRWRIWRLNKKDGKLKNAQQLKAKPKAPPKKRLPPSVNKKTDIKPKKKLPTKPNDSRKPTNNVAKPNALVNYVTNPISKKKSIHFEPSTEAKSVINGNNPKLNGFVIKKGDHTTDVVAGNTDDSYVYYEGQEDDYSDDSDSYILSDSDFPKITEMLRKDRVQNVSNENSMAIETRNFEDEEDDDSDSDVSVGSDAEEILTDEDWQHQPISSNDDSENEMTESQMQHAYREFVENYMRDHEHVQVLKQQSQNDDDSSSDDSCPELVPIYPSEGVAAGEDESSESSFGTEYSCDHSDCCGYSEDDGEEGEEEEDEGWCSVDEGESDVEIDESDDDSELFNTSDEMEPESDDSNTMLDDGSMDFSDADSNDLTRNEYTLYEDTDEDATAEQLDDPHFFDTDRPPLIVSAGQSSQRSWSKLPLDLNQSVSSFKHDTAIENIVRRVRLYNPRPVETIVVNEEIELEEENDEHNEPENGEEPEEEVVFDDVEERPSKRPEIFDQSDVLDGTLIGEDTNDTFAEEPADQTQPDQYGFNDDLDIETSPAERRYRPHFFNSLNSRQVLLVLKSELHFHGILNVTLLAGNARVYGFSLRPNQPVTAFSPRGHSFVSIQPLRPANADNDTQKAAYLDHVQSILTSMESDFISHDIYAAIECFDPSNDVLLLLEPSARQLPGVNMIHKYMRQLVFPNVHSFNQRGAFYSSEFILRTKFFLLPRTKLHVSAQWSAVPLGSTSRTVVLGGKGVGKSTYVRFAANSCIQRYGGVLLIDLDIGQPEIFVPQTISATLLAEPLLGPGYLHNHQPEHALLFGEINVTVSPLKYLRCVLQLLRHCAATAAYADVPWIINTMGYNKGFGPELMAAVLRSFAQCTDVVQIQSQRQLDNYEQIMNHGVVNDYRFNFFHDEVLAAVAGRKERLTYQTHVVRSMARKFGDRTNDWDMSAKDTRFAIVLAHLGALLRDGGEWITDVKPVCASLDDLKVIASEEVSADQHLRLLNGNLVYLCHQSPSDNSIEHVQCLGIGIVRAVDHDTNKIYLLPATPDANQLAATNALAVCTTPLPSSLITNHNRRVTGRVPYVYSTDDFIGSKQVVHISYRPDFTPRKA